MLYQFWMALTLAAVVGYLSNLGMLIAMGGNK